ncbi:DUF6906 family protein [Anaerosolibacter sp.]|uniref:DUF6906 family protein n=1 Tax=Anaerosolibacter sp. TaxID=1872527 RepID=UPI0039F090FD
MKHGKRPTLKQKEKIKSLGLDPKEWLVVKDCMKTFDIVSKASGEVKKYPRL